MEGAGVGVVPSQGGGGEPGVPFAAAAAAAPVREWEWGTGGGWGAEGKGGEDRGGGDGGAGGRKGGWGEWDGEDVPPGGGVPVMGVGWRTVGRRSGSSPRSSNGGLRKIVCLGQAGPLEVHCCRGWRDVA